jgi:hypothetical protein
MRMSVMSLSWKPGPASLAAKMHVFSSFNK